MPYAGGPQWVRPAGHLGVTPNHGDALVPCLPGSGCTYSLDVSGGWYDAGDHGKYVVNAGISVWTLLNWWERTKYLGTSAADFGDGKMNIPESNNGSPTCSTRRAGSWISSCGCRCPRARSWPAWRTTRSTTRSAPS